ncbi:MAG: amidohydrolase [Bacteroidales bacterium]|nr:amidohydrolase [Bacteroidales bacterium]
MRSSDNLLVTLVQTDLVWENKKSNLNSISDRLNQIQKTDLIILPEMFATGFSMKPQLLSEPKQGEVLTQMQNWASTYQSAVLGSVIVKENNQFFNRAYFVFPDGSFQYYDKRHLFRMANEDRHYASGDQWLIIDYKGWKIRPLVCYDLRFPVWSRQRQEKTYDLLIYVANWPERRSEPWKTLLRARAIENLAYVAGVNRVGNDGNDIQHSGDSALIDYKGDTLFEFAPFAEGIETIEINKNNLNEFRAKFPAHLDADAFNIT